MSRVRRGKQESANALRRQWALLRKIPRLPVRKTTAQLRAELTAEGFSVEKRTIERDLLALSEVFPALECDQRERPFGWSWAKDSFVIQVPGMTGSEALALHLIERFIKPLLPASTADSLQSYFKTAAAKLDEISGSPASKWRSKVRVVQPAQALIAPPVNAAVHRAVTEGLLRDRQMEIVYRKRGKAETVTHIVNPLGLVQRGPITYFVVNQSKDPFHLAMHRISKAGILDGSAQRPEGFDIDRHISSGQLGFGGGTNIRLEAIFSGSAAEHLHESPLARDQDLTILPDQRTRLLVNVPHNQQLEWWLLAFGDQVEVISPLDLRERMKSTVLAMARLYARRRHGHTRDH